MHSMNRTTVISEVFRSIGYDPVEHVLEIEVVSGAVYLYVDVPDELHVGLMAADSHGEFFASHIRDAGFEYEKIA
ncbi:MAG: KTSC domain-containing protein [Luteimonas sp.]